MTAPVQPQQTPNPFSPRQRRPQRPANPFSAQPTDPNAPPAPTGTQGPNPSHLNQTGALPQFQRPQMPHPQYASQLGQAQPSGVQAAPASPNPTLTAQTYGVQPYTGQAMAATSQELPQGGQPNNGRGVPLGPTSTPTGQVPPTTAAPPDPRTHPQAPNAPPYTGPVGPYDPSGQAWYNNDPTGQRHAYWNQTPLTGANGQPDWQGLTNAGLDYNRISDQAVSPADWANWSDTIGARDQLRTAQTGQLPYQQAALSRLGNAQDPNALNPNVGQNNPLLSGYENQTGQLAQNAFGQPSTADQSLQLGGQLSGILGNGQVGAQGPDAASAQRLGQSQGYVDSQAQQVFGQPDAAQQTFNLAGQYSGMLGNGQVGGQGYDPATQQRLDQYQQTQDQALQGLTGGPDYGSLAQTAFDAQNKVGDAATQRQLDEYRQQQAADGRLGLSADKGAQDIITQAQNARDADSANLALQAASGTTAQQQARLQGVQGLVGQQANLGQAQQAYGTNLATGNVDRATANATTAAQLGGNTANLVNTTGLNRLGAATGLQAGAQGQANYQQDYATNLGVGNATRQAQNAASAYGLGGQTAASSAANQLGQIGVASGLQGQAFNQGQQVYQNQLGQNQQGYNQLMGFQQAGNPNNLLPASTALAGQQSNFNIGRLGQIQQAALANSAQQQGYWNQLGQAAGTLIPYALGA